MLQNQACRIRSRLQILLIGMIVLSSPLHHGHHISLIGQFLQDSCSNICGLRLPVYLVEFKRFEFTPGFCQDCFDLLGWNGSACTAGLSAGHLYTLTGEAIHLAPLSAVLCGVYCQQSAPWWKTVAHDSVVPAPSSEAAGSSATPAISIPKKRRIGGLKVCRSL
jgi:hypothetical protein